jgi:MinD superfamily P-loop ATPase
MKVAIASGKGGTGKTTLAVNLALRTAETMDVSLLDLDVEEPNSGIFIQGEQIECQNIYRKVPIWKQESCTLCGKCVNLCQFNAILKLGDTILVLPELCHSCYACSELCPSSALPMQNMVLGQLKHYRYGKLSFIESKLEIGVEMASPLIRQTLDFAKIINSKVKYQFQDCSPGASCAVITATKDADFILLVTEPTPFGLYDLNLAVETMRHLGKPMAVVVNRVGIGNDEVFSYCEAQGLPVWARFPNQREIAELYSRGELVYSVVEAFCQGIDQIISELENIRNKL